MLSEILTLLSKEQSLTLAHLAEVVGYPVPQVEGGLLQLQLMGYIHREELGQSCSTGSSSSCSSGCSACSLGPSSAMTAWSLTDKGKIYLTRTPVAPTKKA